jgi:hypothetical protein
VVPSWHTQITLLHAAGGICPVLDFNVPLVTRDRKARSLAPPSSFPAWAALHFWMPQSLMTAPSLRDIMDVGASVLRDPLKAIDGRRQAHNQPGLLQWPDPHVLMPMTTPPHGATGPFAFDVTNARQCSTFFANPLTPFRAGH